MSAKGASKEVQAGWFQVSTELNRAPLKGIEGDFSGFSWIFSDSIGTRFFFQLNIGRYMQAQSLIRERC